MTPMGNHFDADHQHHPAHDRHGFDSAEMADFAALEAEVLGGSTTRATAVIADVAERLGLSMDRILDLGSGPGVGTVALAERFASAAVVAVDASREMLARVSARAERLGLDERITTVLSALPAGLETLGRADLVWASQVLHHVGDLHGTLVRLADLIRPSGLLAIVEPTGPVRVVAADPEDRQAEERERAWTAEFEERWGPNHPTDAAVLREAGLEVVEAMDIAAVIWPPLDDDARRYAERQLGEVPPDATLRTTHRLVVATPLT
jgi:SAM-dependent methyltransferase